ncbi:MAG: DEAD/DEAH box helicase, partial [Proteobacteria bacterium]|nr:DEAD/DEAH box helicase [Pseudomonadota bacterium]NDH59809.1 DEAD/DEAH box helicase [Pseudomonadota bacterium]
RFKNTGASIKLINRHTSKKNKDNYVKGFNDKNIDIVIGTHALFTCGIDFSNTGILIVDEEHKFGIRQKDLIKSKQENIHILYLSATPIPRTMNFIFSGLKEFSFLHTPPSNRLSIKSFLKIETNQLFKEAISREVSRGGQCFIVQNNIGKMNSLKNQLNKLLPDIKIDIAHGKLKKDEISNVMRSFDTGSLDVLICTTIVEMGLDIPNANTILIIDSQNFGLSQLHQLRGRVGRSAKQGYCYFLTPSPELSKIAKNRLDSIIKLCNLGSGFFIAQEDLEIRGGGEILDIESRRLESTAFVLRANDEDLNIFNKDFPFKETADQLEAISAIQKDIALVKPMNRVLCGDVGFGKTEVAMRSAFVSINSDKQVVLLCPSTVLSEQHYESFLERFKNTGASIKLINRHTSKKNKDNYVKGFNDKNI